MFEQFATTTPALSIIIWIKAKEILDGSVKEACSPDKQGALLYSIVSIGPFLHAFQNLCVVQFRPCCQVLRLGPLDLTH